MDRSWMLSSKAIQSAKECIKLVQKEYDVKFTLSHPKLMDMLEEHAEKSDNSELTAAYQYLLSFAPGADKPEKIFKKKQPVETSLEKPGESGNELTETTPNGPPADEAPDATESTAIEDPEETIEFRGKRYAKWRDGKQFKGIYRGQPHYM